MEQVSGMFPENNGFTIAVELPLQIALIPKQSLVEVVAPDGPN